MAFLDKRGGTLPRRSDRGQRRARGDATAPSRSRRRSATSRSASSSAATSARSRPASSTPASATPARPENVLRHQRDRPRDVERPHDAAHRRAGTATSSASSRSGRSASTPRTSPSERAQRLGAPVDRHVGPRERREVRDERAAPPVLPRVADHQVRRGQRGATACSTSPSRCRTSCGRSRSSSAAASSSWRRTPRTTRDLPAPPREARDHEREGGADELERLQILVDGANDKYMLQIFMREAGVALRRRARRPVLLRDHPARGRPGLRLRQLPRALREHRASAA